MSRRPIALGASGVAGCGWTSAVPEVGGAAPEEVTVTVTYRDRIALSRTAALKAQLVDVPRADAPAVVIGGRLVHSGGEQVPFAFELAYDATKFETNHSYPVQARIEDDGRLRFIHDRRDAVTTRGAPVPVEMELRSVATTQR